MLIGFVQWYEELKWGTSKLNPLCNGPLGHQLDGPLPGAISDAKYILVTEMANVAYAYGILKQATIPATVGW